MIKIFAFAVFATVILQSDGTSPEITKALLERGKFIFTESKAYPRWARNLAKQLIHRCDTADIYYDMWLRRIKNAEANKTDSGILGEMATEMLEFATEVNGTVASMNALAALGGQSSGLQTSFAKEIFAILKSSKNTA